MLDADFLKSTLRDLDFIHSYDILTKKEKKGFLIEKRKTSINRRTRRNFSSQ